MTVNEAAALLGIEPGTVRRQIQLGKLRSTKHGRDHWITPRELLRYRKESQRG